MKDDRAAAQDYAPLYSLMNQIKTLAPWDWVTETDIFGVQHPETKALGFVSIMGELGEHFAVAVYLGSKGLDGFWTMKEAGPLMRPEHFFEVPQIQASFEDRNTLKKADRSMIKELGRKYRGRKSWPMFSSYRPGYAPWHIDPDEALFLRYVLEQTLDVARRMKEDTLLTEPEDPDDYFVRVPEIQGDVMAWHDEWIQVPPSPPLTIPITMDIELLEAAKALPQRQLDLEVDLFLMPMEVGARDERPMFPYMLMSVARRGGMILVNELMSAEESLEAMWGQVSLTFLQRIYPIGERPRRIFLRSDLLFGLLQPLAQALDIDLRTVDRLPQFDMAQSDLEEYFRR